MAEGSRRDFLKWLAAGGMTAVGAVAWGDFEAKRISLERRVLRLPRWDADGFRVAVLADFHLGDSVAVERGQRAIRMAMAERPDAIVCAGDMVDGSAPYLIENLLRTFKVASDASCPCFTVMGNHDYHAWHPELIYEAVAKTKFRLLVNEAAEVGGVTIAGIDDGLKGTADPRFLQRGKHSKSLLALFHEPDFVDDVPEHVSLQISGHSHGGQVCLPGGIPVHAPVGARKYQKGFYENTRVPLYVSRGIGTTGPNIRLFCPPEVSILTLREA